MDFSTRKPGSSPGHSLATGILLRSGAAECVLDRRFVLRAGYLYVIPARAAHGFLGSVEADTDGWAFDLPANFTPAMGRMPVVPMEEQNWTDLDRWLSRIHGEQSGRDACSIAMRQALFQAVYIECARTMGVVPSPSESALVASALKVIKTEFAGPLRPRDVAARVGVSAAHLSHELRRVTGKSPSEWIMSTRIDAARVRLLVSAEPVQHIAEALGYADVSQLRRQFRRMTGFSPDGWRRANQARSGAN